MKKTTITLNTNDFLAETFLFDDEQTGQYIKLLCLHNLYGKLSKEIMFDIIGDSESKIYEKFIEINGYYVHQNMLENSILDNCK